jgi:hypothetical protein
VTDPRHECSFYVANALGKSKTQISTKGSELGQNPLPAVPGRSLSNVPAAVDKQAGKTPTRMSEWPKLGPKTAFIGVGMGLSPGD